MQNRLYGFSSQGIRARDKDQFHRSLPVHSDGVRLVHTAFSAERLHAEESHSLFRFCIDLRVVRIEL